MKIIWDFNYTHLNRKPKDLDNPFSVEEEMSVLEDQLRLEV